jgi:hypothetical protein
MLTQTERQSQTNGIQELSLLKNQITPPNNRLEVVLNNLNEHAVQGKQGTNSDSSSSLLALWNSMKEFPKVIQRGSNHDLIKRAC